MTTWRELCRELIDSRGPDYYRALERARKALADGPAVPEGREPAAVVGEPKSPPDWRGLCEELVEALDGWHQAVFEAEVGWVRPDETYLLDRARAALARWGSPNLAELRRSLGEPAERQAAPVPVVVSERLPGAEDCDEKGSCWLWTPDDVDGVGHWSYSHRDWAQEGDVTHWLPAHALPLPGGEVK